MTRCVWFDIIQASDWSLATICSSHWLTLFSQTPYFVQLFLAHLASIVFIKSINYIKLFQEYAEKLRAEFEQEKKRAINVATRLVHPRFEKFLLKLFLTYFSLWKFFLYLNHEVFNGPMVPIGPSFICFVSFFLVAARVGIGN